MDIHAQDCQDLANLQTIKEQYVIQRIPPLGALYNIQILSLHYANPSLISNEIDSQLRDFFNISIPITLDDAQAAVTALWEDKVDAVRTWVDSLP